MEEFQSSFVPPRKFNFSRRRIDNLKTKAAEFLVNKFEIIHSHPGQATQQPWEHRERKDLTKWLLLNIFSDEVVTNKILLLGFSSVERSPNPDR